jgi:hypothetical protein
LTLELKQQVIETMSGVVVEGAFLKQSGKAGEQWATKLLEVGHRV